MSLTELSHILYFSDGVTEESRGLRAAPSAGAIYPVEVYPVINEIQDLKRGIYHYLPVPHEMDLIVEGDFRQQMEHASFGQSMLARANIVIVLSSIFKRIQSRYRERAQRYICLEAGHIAQNIYLTATSMGLGTCAIGAFSDEAVNRLLGLDGSDESALYLIATGRI